MKFNRTEFKQEIITALKYIREIEEHAEEMDPDDIKQMCKDISFPLTRMLNDLEEGKVKEKKF
jgi:predicted secreted protein